jgi:hypothetical protein
MHAMSERTQSATGDTRKHAWNTALVIGEWIVLLLASAYFGGRSLPRAWKSLNTDFPNYYVTARLLREGYSTDRVYEWLWIQRQKDHLGIGKADQPVVGFIPHTPCSALVGWPITGFDALTAKRVWIVVNLALLAWIAALLNSLSELGWRRIALLMVLNYPLHRNLEYGQYYVLILLLVTTSLWCYLQHRRVLAGVLMGIGFGLKIFPVLFFIYFLRKRDLRAAVGLIAGALLAMAVSVATFGWQLNRLYISQVLPWALRGDAMDPYNLKTSSVSSLLHRLFLFEPQWNPHPVLHSPLLFSLLHPLLQVLIFAPAVFLAVPKDFDPRRVRLEWSAFVIAVLAISTLPASYHFTILILPVALIANELIEERDFSAVLLLVALYLAVCFPGWHSGGGDGWQSLLAVPRLYCVVLLCVLSYVVLNRQPSKDAARDRRLWAGAFAAGLLFSILATAAHQRKSYDAYTTRLPITADILLATNAVVHARSVFFTALLGDGYQTAILEDAGIRVSPNAKDELSVAVVGGKVWTEESDQTSTIVSATPDGSSRATEINDAELPVSSIDGKYVAYLRSIKGRSRIWLRPANPEGMPDVPLTPPGLNVSEMSFGAHESLIVAAAEDHRAPGLFSVDLTGNVRPLLLGEARYPAVSGDGQSLAYSRLSHGYWNLWLSDLHSGISRRITDEPCNDISPAWSADGHELIFASDCGRALWFTALRQQKVR